MLRPLALVVAISVAAWLAPAAHAAFEPVPPPPDLKPAGTLVVNSFGVLGGSWFAIDESGRGWLTRTQGTTWEPVDLSGTGSGSPTADVGSGVDFAVGPDQAGYVGGRVNKAPVLIRVTETGALERLFPRLRDDDADSIPTPAFDADGRLWLFLSHFRNLSADAPQLSLVRLAEDHTTVAERLDLPVPKPFDAVQAFRFVGGHAYARYGATFASPVLRLDGGKLEPLDGTKARIKGKAFQPPATLPQLAVGPTVVGFRGISLDNGDNWGQLWRGGDLRAVLGDSTLVARGDWMLRRSGSAFRLTGLAVPNDTRQLFEVPEGIVAVGGRSAPAAMHLHRGSVPAAATVGSPSAYTRRLVTRVNHFRGQAGVPPVIADAGVERAAANHARYLSLNRPRTGATLEQLHGETRGRPGFTGVDAEARCAAVGATCLSEVVLTGAKTASPVDPWVASVYHRLPVTSPAVTAVGAGRRGRFAVLAIEEGDRRALGLEPVVFPRGRYDGPLSMTDEVPDPRQACLRNRQPISRAGTPVTFQTPTEEPPAIPLAAFIQSWPLPDVAGVRLFIGRRAVRGCSRTSWLKSPQQHIAFLPAGPLRRRTSYRAVARWRINPAAPMRSFSWTFRTR